MSDDRPLEDPVEALRALRAELEDFKSTQLARQHTRPTGDIEPTLRTTPKPGTLIANGQTVSRVTYAALWDWVQANGLVVAGGFTVGDGSTTFGLPDYRGRVMRGAAAAEATGLLTGADTKAIAIANLPAHDHSVVVNAVGTHSHAFSTGGGGHGGHFPTDQTGVAGPGGFNVAAWNAGSTSLGHSHSGGVASDGQHGHTATEATVGSGTVFDVRQASFNGQWLIWT